MSFSAMRNSSNGDAGGSNTWLAGTSAPMREVERALGHLAHANVNMVIHGEGGTGKRVLAERIYRQGPRAQEPFVAISLEKVGELDMERMLFAEDGGVLAPQAGRSTVYLNAVDLL